MNSSRSRILLVAFALLGIYLSTTTSLALGLAKIQPDIAMTMPIANGPALARSARFDIARSLEANAQEGANSMREAFPTEVPSDVRKKAFTAFLAEPLSAEAIMTLGLAANAQGEKDKVRAIFAASSDISKREELAALWLAGDASERDDIDEMLSRFDQILRTSRVARPVLLEQFAAATIDSRFRGGMVELLNSAPPWASEFWQIAPNVEAAALSIGELRLALAGSEQKFSRSADVRIAYNLINQGYFALAEDLYRSVTEGNPNDSIVLNDDFANESRFAPVDWQTYSTGNFGSEISTDSGLLYLFAEGSPGGAVARQWITLEPGPYKLRATVRAFGMEEGDSLKATLSCIQGAQSKRDIELVDGLTEIEFSHSADCSQLWFDIVAKPGERNPGFEAEIERLSLETASD